jgi:hypothetical protein
VRIVRESPYTGKRNYGVRVYFFAYLHSRKVLRRLFRSAWMQDVLMPRQKEKARDK